jgi:hypothetical protein
VHRRCDWFRYGSLAIAAALSLAPFASARLDRVAPPIMSQNSWQPEQYSPVGWSERKLYRA